MTPDATGSRAAAEPYVTEFETRVRAVDGTDVRLEETYFYPEGGGQPADRGTIGNAEVVDVQTQDRAVVHTLASTPEFEAGETVVGSIDEGFRTYCMRAHTASHMLYGAGRRLLEDHGYGGFDIGTETCRIDFETSEPDAIDALSLERMLAEAVWESRQVTWREMDIEQARADDEIVFNLTPEAERADTVRIVEIEDWDIAACGGTHVRNTIEIGPLAVLDISNPGADLVRVEYAVGPAAIRARTDRTRATTRAASALETGVSELPERANAVAERNAELEAELDELRDRLLENRLETLAGDAVERDGQEWVVGTLDVDGIGPNDASERAQESAGRVGDIVVLTGVDGSAFVVAATTGETDASGIVEDVTAEFGGGGGGGETLAQGGGLDADPEAVVDYLRRER
ncbi:Threonyl/alanyl tRNA synthetase SAD [Natronococcus amylolyticus DSM 10524]|uniref:Threonyl/alanyl tRNA synthetase SAD n=1 Tax=Natronococcus amylolyticus DSM 10524 TaxID=1227497 RepID=L9X4Y9_9EURY|nr:DHHA1 domain-containing protein [Natronococcus amylolyticus]ELY56775.1 Threonyl/alanyl tRNA synthetase SAD [Natronococcus amylolyticus DSM 10524]